MIEGSHRKGQRTAIYPRVFLRQTSRLVGQGFRVAESQADVQVGYRHERGWFGRERAIVADEDA